MSHHALNKQQFFHVSPHELPEGTVLTPRHGENFEDKTNQGGVVSMTGSHESALEWGAVIGAGRHPVMHMYEVEPSEQPKEVDSGFYGMREHQAPSAKVVKRTHSFDPSEE